MSKTTAGCNLLRLIRDALSSCPSSFDEPAWKVLDRAGMLEGRMPVWYKGKFGWFDGESPESQTSALPHEAKQEAAPLWVWWRDWVRPILKEGAVVAQVMKALPLPEPFPPRKTAHEGGATDAWLEKFQSAPVFLWYLIHSWESLTGFKDAPSIGEYPNTSGLLPEDFALFLRMVPNGFYADLRLRPARIIGRTRDALRWLEQEVVALSGSGAKTSTGEKQKDRDDRLVRAYWLKHEGPKLKGQIKLGDSRDASREYVKWFGSTALALALFGDKKHRERVRRTDTYKNEIQSLIGRSRRAKPNVSAEDCASDP